MPSFPYGITLLNCDGHSMTLGWKVPRFSGGAPILGYFVDRREAQHRGWHEVNAAPVVERILTVGVGARPGGPARWAGPCVPCPPRARPLGVARSRDKSGFQNSPPREVTGPRDPASVFLPETQGRGGRASECVAGGRGVS